MKEPFLRDVLVELKKQITIDDPIFQAFDVFNVADSHSQEEKLEMINTLKTFYASEQPSSFEGETKDADALIEIDISEEMVRNFFIEFRIQTKHLEKKRNEEIKVLVQEGKINNPEGYKDEHPISPGKVCKAMYPEKDRYATLMRLFKFPLLIPPSTANVERGFSVLNLLSTKQRNRLLPENLDKLMRLILLGSDWFDDETWELLVDKYDSMCERRILLND